MPDLAAAVVRFVLGRPVLFRRKQPHLSGRPFILVKFRIMWDPDPAFGALLMRIALSDWVEHSAHEYRRNLPAC